MTRKRLLVSGLILMNNLVSVANVNTMNKEQLSSLINTNLLKIGSQTADWRYSFFEDLKNQEAVKERFDEHMRALQAWYNILTNRRDPSLKSLPMQGSLTMESVVASLLRFNEHIFYTVKEVRQQYLPKNAISPESEHGAIAYQFYTLTKINEIEKLIKLLQKEYGDIDKALKSKLMGPSKEFYQECMRTLEGLSLSVDRFVDELNSVVKAVGQKKGHNAQEPTAQKMGKNDLAVRWPKTLMELEPRVMKDNKDVLPQFKKIKEASINLVQYVSNKGKVGYNEAAKLETLKSMLAGLKEIQRTKLEKKFFLAKKKAIGKEIDELLLTIISDIESNI